MKPVTRFLKAVFNFFVGDWIILGGVAITLLVVALLENTSASGSLKGTAGYLFIIGIALTLLITLYRETRA
ncbi:MAG TPA: hypothetical protein VH186_37815 [Chloroflexia bacterium]|nr:hypothetical protein [Chloroflexia bacterium]